MRRHLVLSCGLCFGFPANLEIDKVKFIFFFPVTRGLFGCIFCIPFHVLVLSVPACERCLILKGDVKSLVNERGVRLWLMLCSSLNKVTLSLKKLHLHGSFFMASLFAFGWMHFAFDSSGAAKYQEKKRKKTK